MEKFRRRHVLMSLFLSLSIFLFRIFFFKQVNICGVAIYRSNHRRCSVKKIFLEDSQNSQENICASLFFNKVNARRPATLLKKSLWHRCFPVNFTKFLKTPVLQSTSRRLLLHVRSTKTAPSKISYINLKVSPLLKIFKPPRCLSWLVTIQGLERGATNGKMRKSFLVKKSITFTYNFCF